MPIIFTNWTFNKVGMEFFFEAWVPLEDHSRFRSIKSISKYYTYYSENYSGKKTQFYQYIIPMNGIKIKEVKTNNKGWTFSLSGNTILIMFSSSFKNNKYGQKTIKEIEDIIIEINTGIPVILPASSSEIINQMINESIKLGLFVQQPIPETKKFRRTDDIQLEEKIELTPNNGESFIHTDISRIGEEKIEEDQRMSYFIKSGSKNIHLCDEKLISGHLLSTNF